MEWGDESNKQGFKVAQPTISLGANVVPCEVRAESKHLV